FGFASLRCWRSPSLLPHFHQLTSFTLLGRFENEGAIFEALESIPNLKRLECFSGLFLRFNAVIPAVNPRILAKLDHFGCYYEDYQDLVAASNMISTQCTHQIYIEFQPEMMHLNEQVFANITHLDLAVMNSGDIEPS